MQPLSERRGARLDRVGSRRSDRKPLLESIPCGAGRQSGVGPRQLGDVESLPKRVVLGLQRIDEQLVGRRRLDTHPRCLGGVGALLGDRECFVDGLKPHDQAGRFFERLSQREFGFFPRADRPGKLNLEILTVAQRLFERLACGRVAARKRAQFSLQATDLLRPLRLQDSLTAPKLLKFGLNLESLRLCFGPRRARVEARVQAREGCPFEIEDTRSEHGHVPRGLAGLHRDFDQRLFEARHLRHGVLPVLLAAEEPALELRKIAIERTDARNCAFQRTVGAFGRVLRFGESPAVLRNRLAQLPQLCDRLGLTPFAAFDLPFEPFDRRLAALDGPRQLAHPPLGLGRTSGENDGGVAVFE